MKVLLQRVSRAHVKVKEEVVGSIQNGFLLFVGIHSNDTEKQMEWIANKIVKLRVFEDSRGKMNRSLIDVSGDILVVSQFTLYGDTRKGNRPSFIDSAPPEYAEPLYEKMIQWFKEHTTLRVESGQFGEMMEVELINEGPVTLLLER